MVAGEKPKRRARLLVETGVVDYWRQTGKWGDGCAPVGEDDFQCR